MNMPATTEQSQGKPPILQRDRDRAKNALKAVANGHSTTMAAQAAGVARRTIYFWLEKGKQIRELREEAPEHLPLTPYDEEYTWFLEQWELAEYKRKEELLERINDAGKKTWQANAWLLERLHPEEFSAKREVKVSDARTKESFRLNMGNNRTVEAIEGRDYEVVED